MNDIRGIDFVPVRLVRTESVSVAGVGYLECVLVGSCFEKRAAKLFGQVNFGVCLVDSVRLTCSGLFGPLKS